MDRIERHNRLQLRHIARIRAPRLRVKGCRKAYSCYKKYIVLNV